jgi:hypothetical protein
VKELETSDGKGPWLMGGRLVKKHLFIPPEHGAWIWLFGPFIIGAAAGRNLSWDVILCVGAGLAAFFVRQPATILVKIASGRRPRRDLVPALLWMSLDGTIALGLSAILVWRGYTQVLVLALPAIPVFVWHLWLVSRRAERRREGVQVVAAGVLALAAPAAYWTGGGESAALPWLLWVMTWFQSAASIVFVQLRLRQRHWTEPRSLQARLVSGRRALMYAGFNALAALVAWVPLGLVPVWVALGFWMLLGDVIDGVLRPAVGARPTAVGLRQAASSGLFVALAGLGFALA